MSSRKRNREGDLVIKVASGDTLQADSLLVRSLCDSARGLPAAAEEWDVSGLLREGQPFSRETVSCWLSCVYSLVDGLTELRPQDVEQLSTVAGLTDVLAFADAVGASAGLLSTACSQIKHLKFKLLLPEQPEAVELPVTDFAYWFYGLKQLQRTHLREGGEVGGPLASHQQCQDVRQQVAKQVAALLQLAHVLHLQPLLDLLHQFLLLNGPQPDAVGLLSDVMGLVFTDAVLEAALGSSTVSKEAYISSVLSQPFSLTPGKMGHSSLLKPVGPKAYDRATNELKFDAQLLRDFAGGRTGDTVKVELDLFGGDLGEGSVKIIPDSANDLIHYITLPVQLLLGSTFPDAAALEAFLAAAPPAQ